MRKNLFLFVAAALFALMVSCNKSSTNNNTTPSTSSSGGSSSGGSGSGGGTGGGTGGGGTTTPTPAFSVSVNGSALLTGSSLYAHKATLAGATTANLAAAITYNGKSWSFGISLSKYNGAKTYKPTSIDTVGNFQMSEVNNSTNAYSAFQVFYNTSPGSVIVTKDDGTYIQGTFSGTIYKGSSAPTDSMKITNGTFVFKWQ
ncbi:MAG: hypothetical protein JST82_15780 [Bacteroidetes bacterium]|nr:hypothetical protein [Bacteroidota bacterium]